MNFTNAEIVLYVLMRCLIPTAVFGHCGIGKSSLPLQLVRRRRKELGQPYKDISMTSRNSARIDNNPDHFGFWQWDIPISEKDEAIGYGVTINLLDMAFKYALSSGDANIGHRADKIIESLRKEYWKRYPENEGRDIFVVYVRNHRFIPPPSHRGGGVHALEELNRDQSGLRGPVCQMGLTGGFLDHVQPPGVWMYASMNPPDGEYEAIPLDSAMMDRFATISVHSDIDSWTSWALKSDLDRGIIESVVNNRAQAFNPHDKPFVMPRRLCTSRSLNDLNAVMSFAFGEEGKKLNLEKIHLMDLAGSIIGDTAGTLIVNDLLNPDRERAIPYERIIGEYGWEAGKGAWEDYYDGLDHTQDDKPGRDNSKIHLSETRRQVKAMIGSGTENMGKIGLTNAGLMDWLRRVNDRIGKKGTPSEEDFRGFMNFCLYAMDLPEDVRRGMVASYHIRTSLIGLVEKFETMAFDRGEDLFRDLLGEIGPKMGNRLAELEAAA